MPLVHDLEMNFSRRDTLKAGLRAVIAATPFLGSLTIDLISQEVSLLELLTNSGCRLPLLIIDLQWEGHKIKG